MIGPDNVNLIRWNNNKNLCIGYSLKFAYMYNVHIISSLIILNCYFSFFLNRVLFHGDASRKFCWCWKLQWEIPTKRILSIVYKSVLISIFPPPILISPSNSCRWLTTRKSCANVDRRFTQTNEVLILISFLLH